MPDLLAGETAEQRGEKIRAILHFLASLPDRAEHFELKRPPLEIVHPQFWDRGDVVSGQELFHRVGCIACHAPDKTFQAKSFDVPERQRQLRELGLDDEEIQELLEDSLPDDAPAVPLPNLHRKYSARSLAFFLLNPLLTRPAGRMPDLHLTPAESADLAAYLRTHRSTVDSAESPDTAFPLPLDTLPAGTQPMDHGNHGDNPSAPMQLEPTLIEQGRRHFQSLGCVECHPLAGVESTRSFSSWDGVASRKVGCRAAAPAQGIPYFALTAAQEAALDHVLPKPDDRGDTQTESANQGANQGGSGSDRSREAVRISGIGFDARTAKLPGMPSSRSTRRCRGGPLAIL
jgi:mono/diheme cytochrome c family protein